MAPSFFLPNPKSKMRNVTLADHLSRHVTDNVTDVLEKNLGKTDLVTLSRLKRGVASPGLSSSLPAVWTDRDPFQLPTDFTNFTFLHFLKLSKASPPCPAPPTVLTPTNGK